jgi:hypothetical protein
MFVHSCGYLWVMLARVYEEWSVRNLYFPQHQSDSWASTTNFPQMTSLKKWTNWIYLQTSLKCVNFFCGYIKFFLWLSSTSRMSWPRKFFYFIVFNWLCSYWNLFLNNHHPCIQIKNFWTCNMRWKRHENVFPHFPQVWGRHKILNEKINELFLPAYTKSCSLMKLIII